MSNVVKREVPEPVRRFGKLLTRNAPIITTTTAVVGTIGVAVLASQAGIKAHDVLRREERYREAKDMEPMKVQEKVLMTWKFYAPTALCVVATLASIITLNRVGERRAASAAALYAMSEAAFREYRERVVEKIGNEGADEITHELAQIAVDKNPPRSEIVIFGEEVLFMDSYSGRYFKGNVEEIRSYVNEINHEVITNMYASLTEFYDKVGLDHTASSDDVGWNSDNLMDVEFTPAMAPKNRPCLVVNYTPFPVTGYDRSY